MRVIQHNKDIAQQLPDSRSVNVIFPDRITKNDERPAKKITGDKKTNTPFPIGKKLKNGKVFNLFRISWLIQYGNVERTSKINPSILTLQRTKRILVNQIFRIVPGYDKKSSKTGSRSGAKSEAVIIIVAPLNITSSDQVKMGRVEKSIKKRIKLNTIRQLYTIWFQFTFASN